MTRNPEIENLQARQRIDEILTKSLPLMPSGMMMNLLVKKILLEFAVSPNMIRSFIKEFYIDTKIVKLDEDILYSIGGINEEKM